MGQVVLPEDIFSILHKLDERMKRAEQAISRPDDGGIVQGGLNAWAYYNDSQGLPFWWDVVSVLDQTDWGLLDPATGEDRLEEWTMIMHGFIRFKYAETYTISCTHDDGAEVFVGGTNVISDWNAGVEETHQGDVVIDDPPTPLRPIRIHHYQDTGPQTFRLTWESPSQPLEIIPQDALFFETPRWQPVALPTAAGGCGAVFVGDGGNSGRQRPLLVRKLLTGRVQFRGEAAGANGDLCLMPPGWRTGQEKCRWATTSPSNVFCEIHAYPGGQIFIGSAGGGDRSLDIVNYYAYDEYGASEEA